MERESIRQLFHGPGQPASLFIALHVILAPHSLKLNCVIETELCKSIHPKNYLRSCVIVPVQ